MPKPLLLAALFIFPSAAHAADDIVLADFEGPDYGAWQARGTAFGARPAGGAIEGQMPVTGFKEKGLANSFVGGDDSQGTLSSPPFKIERAHISFLIGGGGFAGQTCLNLLIEGKIVRTRTGSNTRPGGSEALELAQWDVRDLLGRTATLEIVDSRGGSWGHITVDHITQTDAKAQGLSGPQTRTMTARGKYLHLPVRDGAPKRTVQVLVDGQPRRFFEIELAEGGPNGAPSWWAPLDISAWKGRKVEVRIDRMPAESRVLELLEQSDELKNSESLYREAGRPQLRFSARRGWLNDPNGLVFDGREYHLYFQHNPYGRAWGNMHWGHATSTDLVRWREQPIAIYPHAPGDDAFSGSAIVDRANTSGWKTGANDLLVAAYTSTGRGECIVYSNDRGRTWTEFEGNPVVRHQGRDPRLLWHQPTRRWVMAVYNEDATLPQAERQGIVFYTSPNLKAWTKQSRIAGFFECPDLFELPVEGGAEGRKERKWVLVGASSEYMVGRFDGRVFTPETPKLRGHLGRGFYASQTFSNEPRGRTIQIGWLQMDTPHTPSSQAMSLPLVLSLRATQAGPRLAWKPTSELESLRAKSHRMAALTLRAGAANPLAQVSGELLELRVDFEPGTADEVRFTLRGVVIRYDARKQELWVGDHRADAPLVGGRQKIIAFVDRAGVEVFASDGLVYVPLPIIPNAGERGAEVSVAGGEAKMHGLEVHELKLAWDGAR